ncbi:hypothetical protein [Deinococcus sp. LM3]|uniref:hypothetical protein n=1 Tax=Deinococcus sp. LM3 TaxID=1938608 RepID=UPI00117E1825|nr:hypothetical protein [Deinococcus sp. LM3]
MTMIAVLNPGPEGIHDQTVCDVLIVGGPNGLPFLDFRRKLLAGDPDIRGVAAHATTDNLEMRRLLLAIRPHLYTVQLLDGYWAALQGLLLDCKTWTPDQRLRVGILSDLLLKACSIEDVPDFRQHSKMAAGIFLPSMSDPGGDDLLFSMVKDARSAHKAAQPSAPGNAPLERLLEDLHSYIIDLL